MPKRGAGEGNIRRRKDGRWEARVRYENPDTGLPVRVSVYAITRSEAAEKLRDIQRRIENREPVRDERAPLADLLMFWLERVIKHTKRPATYRSYRIAAEHHIIPALGSVPLFRIDTARIRVALVQSNPINARSRALALIVLRLALDFAVEENLIASNPAKRVRATRIAHREMRVLTKSEAKEFLAAAKGDRLESLYFVALTTGMRQGELLALQWSDIDFDAAEIRIVRSLDNHSGVVGPVKTQASQRSIAIDRQAITALRRQRAALQGRGYTGDLVWPNTAGKYLAGSNVRRRSFLRIQSAAGIDPPIRFHDLRHTAATLMLLGDVHPKIVSERLGHASVAITLDIYSHVIPGLQAKAARVMGQMLANPGGGQDGGQSF
jgi:integrase